MKQLFGFLLLVGLVLAYWQYVVALVVLVVLWKLAPRWWAAYQVGQQARRERVAGLVARAEQQNRWANNGDPGGTYGDYTPAI